MSPSPLPALDRTIALVGLMGAGKSSIGRRLAARLGLPFRDADTEIEKAAGCTIEEIFARYGEAEFRDGERRVIARLLEEPPHVLATGGGAFMNDQTRALLGERALTVWLRADLETLLDRVSRRSNRPLLKQGDPREVLSRLMAVRHPVYAGADVTVDSRELPADDTTEKVIDAIRRHLGPAAAVSVPVELADRRYTIEIGPGLIDRAGELCAPYAPKGRVVVVTDDVVAPLHLERTMAALARAGLKADRVILPAGERSKDLAEFGRLMTALLDLKPDRRTVLIALGGGVVGDLTGFAASVLLRGVDFIQIPTTLLAQVDSSVGGKTGLNTPHGKNLIGTFYQPRLVLADTGVLDTLPRRELLAGYAEVAKYGLIDEPDFFSWLETNGAAVIAGDAAARAHAIAASCRAKARIVAADERETADLRALLNLGHTFGHALEAEAGFGPDLLHGESVAIGMVMAFELSAALGLCSTADVERVRAHLAGIGLPTTPPERIANKAHVWSARTLIEHMRSDKKATAGALTFVLARGIGGAFVQHGVDPAPVERTLERTLARAPAA